MPRRQLSLLLCTAGLGMQFVNCVAPCFFICRGQLLY
jgi:hypothetical protein